MDAEGTGEQMVGIIIDVRDDLWCQVEWANETMNYYRVGFEGAMDLAYAEPNIIFLEE